jgi:hypothetical protein
MMMFIFKFDQPFTERLEKEIHKIADIFSTVNFILFTLDDEPHLCIFDSVYRHYHIWEKLQEQYDVSKPQYAGSFYMKDGKYKVIDGITSLSDKIDQEGKKEAKEYITKLLQ